MTKPSTPTARPPADGSLRLPTPPPARPHHFLSAKKVVATGFAVAIPITIAYGLGILCAIFLVVAASKRSATMLMVWIVLTGIEIAFLLIGLGIDTEDIIQSLVSIGLSIWALLIAIGARQEVQSGAYIA